MPHPEETTDGPGEKHLVEQELAAYFLKLSGVDAKITIVDEETDNFHLATARRTTDGFELWVDWKQFNEGRIHSLQYRVIPVLVLLQHDSCSVDEVVIDFGDRPAGAATSTVFCRKRDEAGILVPDFTFIESRGFFDLKECSKDNRIPWSARSDVMLWRGVTTGDSSFREEFGGHLPRVRMCLIARDIPDTDVKIVDVVQSGDPAADLQYLLGKGVFDPERRPIEYWADRKFAIDIDGNSNSFATLLHRQILGCCVLKVESRGDWCQWFYDRLVPWIHYVPIKSDLSDLASTIAWCRSNDELCSRIAEQGRAFAMDLEYDSECVSSVGRINSAFAT